MNVISLVIKFDKAINLSVSRFYLSSIALSNNWSLKMQRMENWWHRKTFSRASRFPIPKSTHEKKYISKKSVLIEKTKARKNLKQNRHYNRQLSTSEMITQFIVFERQFGVE